MFLPRSSNFIDISHINASWITEGLFWIFAGNALNYTLKRLQIPTKSKQFYFGFRGLKYQLLFNYAGWKISRKRKGPWFMNYEMSKIEKHYYCQMIISEALANPEQVTEEFNVFLPLFHQTYPEKFREFFGETKSEIRARLNIEQFFLTVFA